MSRQSSIHIVVGARPNYMKVKVLLELLPRVTLIHTGQHFSPEMASSFLGGLGIRQPDVMLSPNRRSQMAMIADLMSDLEEFWETNRAGLVIVVGDVNSTAAAALTASRLGIPVAHIEAGLRSRDLSMPEEVNRILADACSKYLFCSESSGVENLRTEGRSDGIFHVGNTMIDCLVSLLPQIEQSTIVEKLELAPSHYAVCTFHRPSNVDDPQNLHRILHYLNSIGEPVVYPVHPRVTLNGSYRNIRTVSPLFYADFIKLVKDSRFVITDSGGIQEETTFLNVPCLTYRGNTERPSTIEHGTNELLLDLDDFPHALERVRSKTSQGIEKWDGRASRRIVDILRRDFPGVGVVCGPVAQRSIG